MSVGWELLAQRGAADKYLPTKERDSLSPNDQELPIAAQGASWAY